LLDRWNSSRNDDDAKIGFLDPPILPGETESRKPVQLPTKGQAQQERVDQQREQQRKRQPPAFKAHALAASRRRSTSILAIPNVL